MLKLRKIQILGFKSFCDKTEVVLPGNGIAVVVGPNGCGKSNILDGVTWVLGEQSAKSLRGSKMEDVIFAGTRERRALGMAEVSITLIDPEVYNGSSNQPEAVIGDSDWDEAKLREAKAEEAERIIAASQPGQLFEDVHQGMGGSETFAEEQGTEPTSHDTAPDTVVLKIRRRKFQKSIQHGEIVVTRRLFRTGESEYLLNGKLCRLSDIRDIFMGTGLGPESYAIIGQERIGQLLSSKPHERRAIIEEAAGITRFKTKKRLAELRLEQARQNLSRIDDIFEEVTRQMVALKRQAAKAERYDLLRDELRTRLRVVLASKLVRMDEEAAVLASEIAKLSSKINAQSSEIEDVQKEVAIGQERGYALDATIKEKGQLASESAVDLERTRNRHSSNAERIEELESRTAASTSELEYAELQIAELKSEREQHHTFLQTAASEAAKFRTEAERRQAEAREAFSVVGQTEARLEAARHEGTQLLHQIGQVRREQAQAEESLAALGRDTSRLAGEMEVARRDLDALAVERGQVSIRFNTAADALKQLETELAAMQAELGAKRVEEGETRKRGDHLRSERAILTGRRNSLDALLQEHSYSTDTVKKLFQANSLTGEWKPIGILADFLEVGEQYETIVDEFLRDELNYIVVKSWDAAEEGMRLLKSGSGNASGSNSGGGVEGRATFLVRPDDSQAKFSLTVNEDIRVHLEQGDMTRLKDCIRIMDGFGKSFEMLLPKLRDGYVTGDRKTARSLALENPNAFFLAPTGECFHNITVTAGKQRAEGPLALKRELRDVQAKLTEVETQLTVAKMHATVLVHALENLIQHIDLRTEDRRHAERESAHQSAALRQMDGEKQRLERRLGEYALQSDRARAQRDEKAGLIVRKREVAEQLEHTHTIVNAKREELQATVASARAARDNAQAAAAQVSVELAGLEERKRGAEARFLHIDRMFAEGERRVTQIRQQIASAAAEGERREQENLVLEERESELQLVCEVTEAEIHTLGEEVRGLRIYLSNAETHLKHLRGLTEEAREQRSMRSTAVARLAAELGHLSETSVQDLGLEASALRASLAAKEFLQLSREILGTEEEACREMKRRLETMGPVNMMALEEFKETEVRHGFLEIQRGDLLLSIDNTRSTIRELDGVSQTKFNQAFERINENFSQVFTQLFGGGQVLMRLTDEENSNDSGIDIVAQPPGKKLQNVFLLSGGEKALTALSLLMGIFMYQPAPFCVLDEVDAPLDETNVGRLAEMLRSMAVDTQFVMVTHSKRMMTAADMIYGVTMQEPGVSKVVSVRLNSGEPTLHGRERPQRDLALA